MLDRLGTHTDSWLVDRRHLGFVFARYTFVAKMLAGRRNVLEVGAGDGTGSQIVRDVVGELVLTDCDDYPGAEKWDPIKDGPLNWGFDAAYALDVLEHIPAKYEETFLESVRLSLDEGGVLIVGMPSLESQPYASESSKLHHVNCKTEDGLRATLRRHFRNVFLFGMNDSALHTGFGPMCHYRLAICT